MSGWKKGVWVWKKKATQLKAAASFHQPATSAMWEPLKSEKEQQGCKAPIEWSNLHQVRTTRGTEQQWHKERNCSEAKSQRGQTLFRKGECHRMKYRCWRREQKRLSSSTRAQSAGFESFAFTVTTDVGQTNQRCTIELQQRMQSVLAFTTRQKDKQR